MFFELEDWDTIIDLSKVTHISVFEGSHKFKDEYEYSLFGKKLVKRSYLVEPRLKIWYSTDADPFTFTYRKNYEVYQAAISPVYDQKEIEKLLNEAYDGLKQLYNSIKKVLNVYEDEEENTTETATTVH